MIVLNDQTSIDIEKLIEITQGFIDLTKDLLSRGKITEDQYIEMTQNKYRFLENVHKQSMNA